MIRLKTQLKLLACCFITLVVSTISAYALWGEYGTWLACVEAPGVGVLEPCVEEDRGDDASIAVGTVGAMAGNVGVMTLMGWLLIPLLPVLERSKPRRVPSRWKSRWEGSRRWVLWFSGLASLAALLCMGLEVGDGLELAVEVVGGAKGLESSVHEASVTGFGEPMVLGGGLLLASRSVLCGLLCCLEAVFVPEMLRGEARPKRNVGARPAAASAGTGLVEPPPRTIQREDRRNHMASSRRRAGQRPERLWDGAGQPALGQHPARPRAAHHVSRGARWPM